MPYEILKNIPHKRVVTGEDSSEEIYDLYQLGIFNKKNIELVELQPKTFYKQHYHKHSQAAIYIIFGTGIFLLGENKVKYKQNMQIDIAKNVLHGFVTNTKTLFLSIQSPPILDPKTSTIDLHYLQKTVKDME
ncbi:cupin domain-containing protein [Thiotrichales bacterium 19X7-9]|nr:cupin domain-containing protein [Thiotrichales bacterium 19X7-9]TNF69729.1 MAG: cupin domain-containing protein [Gammaproteobacteria bacterium]UTW42445.1 cupin domain-containing protein [bacterium SCSIO 12844]